ncbi:MAG: phospholipase D-like domain-containing protein [Pseudomonadota bacterium]
MALRYRFPWRTGNRFELLIDGASFYPRMLAAIAEARASILMEIYLVRSGAVLTRFIDALLAAAARGVRIHLLFDDFGAIEMHEADRARLRHPNITLCFYNPLSTRSWLRAAYLALWKHTGPDLHRDHRKLVIIDGAIAFTGGAGLCDEFWSDPPSALDWRENMLVTTGPLVQDYITLFSEAWSRHAGQPVTVIPTECVWEAPPANGYARLTVSSNLAQNEIGHSLLKRINNAEHRIWIASAYFIPSWRILRALKKAALNKVDVRLLLPGPITDHPGVRHASRRHYYRLLKAGVRIFEYQPRFTHVKTVLCDQWVSIGSSNFDHWNLRWNLEANQEIEDEAFGLRVQEMFLEDFSHCQEITPAFWRERPWRHRLLERLFGRIDTLLIHVSNQIQSKFRNRK